MCVCVCPVRLSVCMPPCEAMDPALQATTQRPLGFVPHCMRHTLCTFIAREDAVATDARRVRLELGLDELEPAATHSTKDRISRLLPEAAQPADENLLRGGPRGRKS